MVRTLVTKTTGRVVIARLEPGEDILRSIETISRDNEILSGELRLIGAVSRVHLGYFDRESKTYKDYTMLEDLEIVSCMGNISKHKDGYVVHAHVVASDEKGKCYGGHLLEGCEVSVTIEAIITEFPVIERERDELTGLNLLNV
ncbi:MAG: DNA-binding protein [Candidatus Thorarchaeota archaeon]|nr:DNA-binding protein [Candidatus Thorarchaeota archaeon]